MPKKASADARDELKIAADALLDEVVNGTDDVTQRYVARLAAEAANAHRVHGIFKRWSAHNRSYLHVQVKRRGASTKGLFAGVEQWRKLGRAVRPEELTRPYRIFGSPVVNVRNPRPAAAQGAGAPAQAQPQPAQPAAPAAGAGNAPAVHRMYRKPPIIEVFDWTQTYSTDPEYVEPDWETPLAVGDYTTLHTLVTSSPVPVVLRTDIGGMNENGWLNVDGITVDASRPLGNQISTLLHELGHHYGKHLEMLTDTRAAGAGDDGLAQVRARCEQEAALTQWFALTMLGLDEQVGNDITAAASAYLRSWLRTDEDGNEVPVEGKKLKRKLLGQRLDAAIDAANAIVTAYREHVGTPDTAVARELVSA